MTHPGDQGAETGPAQGVPGTFGHGGYRGPLRDDERWDSSDRRLPSQFEQTSASENLGVQPEEGSNVFVFSRPDWIQLFAAP